MSDESLPKTLYVGNLSHNVTEQFLYTLFGSIGPIQSCKIIHEINSDPYAFVEYETHINAFTALGAMNKRQLYDREIKVNWASSPGSQPKQDISNHYHVFVGDLSAEIETDALKKAFAPFGEITNCRIVRDPQTMKPKGYAFVSFAHKHEAENAIASMNGQWLGMRPIRTNWSTRKPGTQTKSDKPSTTFDEVFNQSSPTNCTVYCGGFSNNSLNEEVIARSFSPFGPIQDIRVFRDKGYAFIRFINKESAARAIEHANNSEINGQMVKCHWGKENGPSAGMSVNCAMDQSLVSNPMVVPNSVNGGGNQQYSYGYHQSQQQQHQHSAAAAAAAAAVINAQSPQGSSLWYPQYMNYCQQTGFPQQYTFQSAAAAASPNYSQQNPYYLQWPMTASGATVNSNIPNSPLMYNMPQYQTQ